MFKPDASLVVFPLKLYFNKNTENFGYLFLNIHLKNQQPRPRIPLISFVDLSSALTPAIVARQVTPFDLLSERLLVRFPIEGSSKVWKVNIAYTSSARDVKPCAPLVGISVHVKESSGLQNYPQSYPAVSLIVIIAL